MPVFQNILSRLEELIYILPSVIIAMSFHEFGHAYMAYRMGDPTAKNLGRMTLNPFAHIDIMGMLMMVLFRFGWAKPVPVNPRNYRSYKKGEILVSLAGVTMNLLLACVGAICLNIQYAIAGNALTGAAVKLYYFLYYFTMLNCSLMVFNLLPIFPLDGFHLAEVLFSKYLGPKPFIFLRKYGMYILLGLIILGNGYFSIIGTVADAVLRGLVYLFGLPLLLIH